jgi:hypothetical protein
MKKTINFQKEVNYGKIQSFQGYEPEGVMTFQPKKKPKGGEFTELEKEKKVLLQ